MQFDEEISSRKVPIMKQEMQFPCCLFYGAEERKFQPQVKEAAGFERRLWCAEIPWKLKVNAAEQVAVMRLC